MTSIDSTSRPVGSMAPVLSFNHTQMTFPDGTEAVRDVSLDISPGEFVTIVGPSGCGKSTLLKIASGLLDATGGEVAVDRDRLGYVFQDATLLPWRTVLGNVELLAELHDIPKAERRQLALEAIETVGLSGFVNHYPKSLSGGMKMRASLARTLTLKPPVFLLTNHLVRSTKSLESTSTMKLSVCSNLRVLLVFSSLTQSLRLCLCPPEC